VVSQGERRIFSNFHRQVFCWTDQWFGLTMADIRELEDKTKVELDEVCKICQQPEQLHDCFRKVYNPVFTISLLTYYEGDLLLG